MKSKTSKLEIHSVAINHKLPDCVVQEIVESAFRMVHDTISKADRETCNFENIQLANFGKFFVSEKRKKFLLDFNTKRRNESNTELRQEGIDH